MSASSPFFDRPILNSPYEYPRRHWELDDDGQPTQRILDRRRSAKFVTPIPKTKKHRNKTENQQLDLELDEGLGLSTASQAYDLTGIIDNVREQVDLWRARPAPDWRVTPETARLLCHWRHHSFAGIRPFFCQVEAVETAIWLTEVAPQSGRGGKKLWTTLPAPTKEPIPVWRAWL
jgi:type III restriction enzyme